MSDSVVTNPIALPTADSFRLRIIAAFFAIYFLWGTTFLAIRIAVEELPPLFAAGARFLIAGLVLYAFMRVKGEPRPTSTQWRSLAIMGLLMFVVVYGLLFWAQKYVPSGIAAVLEATIPIDTLILEMLILRRQRFRWAVAVSTLIGFAGVGILLLRGNGQTYGLVPCFAILAASLSWSLGAVISRSFHLPSSRPLTAGAAMMLGGATLLALSAAFGEMHPFPHISLRGVEAELYLIVFGSLVAFTAFVWLLAHMSATRVSSHAYVNPIVAVALGYFVASEPVTLRTLAGTVLVLVSVFLILRPAKQFA
ncbi:MAG: EamA family transporter [Terracidiphilus sp.]